MLIQVVQWLIGFMLDMFPRSELGGADPEGYRWAFFVLVACQLAAACWFALASYLNIGRSTMLEKIHAAEKSV